MPIPAKDPKTGKFLPRDIVEPEPEVDDQPKLDAKSDDKKKVDTTAIRKFAGVHLGVDNETADDEAESARVEKEKDDKDKADADTKEKARKEQEDKSKVKPKPAAAKREPLTEEQIAEAASRGTTKAIDEREARREAKPKEKDKPVDAGPELPPSEKRKVDNLRHMEKIFSDRPEYKNIADRYVKSLEEFSAYADKWEAANPGQSFDENDEQHAAFMRKNEVPFEQDDYVEALADIRVQSAVEQREAKMNERLSKYEKQEKLREASPYIESEKTRSARKFWKAFGDDYADLVSETGAVDRTKLAELQKKDPDALALQLQSAERLDVFVAQSYALINGLTDFNPENKTHTYLSNFALSKEKDLMKRPENERVDGQGRAFKPRAEFHKLSEDQQQKHWTFSVTDLAMLLADEESERVSRVLKEEEDKFNRRAAARGLKINDQPATDKNGHTGKDDVDEDEDEPDDRTEKPKSPSSASEPKMAASARRGGKVDDTPASTFGTRFLGA